MYVNYFSFYQLIAVNKELLIIIDMIIMELKIILNHFLSPLHGKASYQAYTAKNIILKNYFEHCLLYHLYSF